MSNNNQAGSDSSDSVGSQSGVTRRIPMKMRKSCVPERESSTSSDFQKFNLKVPPFSPDDPEIWFAILEGQFDNFGITEDTVKFNNVITKLDIIHAKAVKDIIVNPPHENRYTKIKNELIRRLSASHEKKVKQLLTHEELGDRKASQFLRHLRDLAGPSVPEEFLRTIWSNRLPRSIQTVLASQPTEDLEQLANLADRIQEISAPGNVAATSAPSTVPAAVPVSSTSGEIAELRKMVERLAVKLDEHTRDSRSRRPDRSDHQHRRRSSSRSTTRSPSSYRQYPICWYHGIFKSRARNCQKPCDFNKSGNGTGNHQ